MMRSREGKALHLQHTPSGPRLYFVDQDGCQEGAWWVQLWDGDSLLARVYGATPKEARRRAAMFVATPEAGPSTDRGELPLSSDRADLAASIASAGKVAPDTFASWPRNVLEQLAADLYAFISELGPHPRERLEQHARYEAALRTIAEYGYASKDWQLARDTLNGK